MKGTIFAAFLSVAAFIATPLYAQQQTPPGCYPDRETMVAELTSEKYDEVQLFAGTTLKYARKGVTSIEFWLNLDEGTFTYLFVYGNGVICVGDAGENINLGPFDNTIPPEGDPT